MKEGSSFHAQLVSFPKAQQCLENWATSTVLTQDVLFLCSYTTYRKYLGPLMCLLLTVPYKNVWLYKSWVLNNKIHKIIPEHSLGFIMDLTMLWNAFMGCIGILQPQWWSNKRSSGIVMNIHVLITSKTQMDLVFLVHRRCQVTGTYFSSEVGNFAAWSFLRVLATKELHTH